MPKLAVARPSGGQDQAGCPGGQHQAGCDEAHTTKGEGASKEVLCFTIRPTRTISKGAKVQCQMELLVL